MTTVTKSMCVATGSRFWTTMIATKIARIEAVMSLKLRIKSKNRRSAKFHPRQDAAVKHLCLERCISPRLSFLFLALSHTVLDELQLRLCMPRIHIFCQYPRNKRVPAYVMRQMRFLRGNFQMKGSQPLWLLVALSCRSLTASFARIVGEAFQRYSQINGEQCAASFAY
jgi:hypothetical protein